MLLFASKKVYKTACIMYRNLWESCEKVYFQRESLYNDYIRLTGTINGFRYQVHINSPEICGPILEAMSSHVEQAVKHALCGYVLGNGYNPEICDYINSVNWLPAPWDMD